jgi:hypothetical protein
LRAFLALAALAAVDGGLVDGALALRGLLGDALRLLLGDAFVDDVPPSSQRHQLNIH